MAIPIRGMAPLLAVFDMPASIRFYRDVLGFAVTETSRPAPPGDRYGWALLGLNGVEVMLNTAYDDGGRPAGPDPARVAAHQDTTLFFGCQDLDAAYATLRAHGVDAEAPFVQPYGMRQLYLRDPDGYGLCFQWPADQAGYDRWADRYGMEPAIVDDARADA
jgi:glyoxylase I family protein